jgi:hypothetical protein
MFPRNDGPYNSHTASYPRVQHALIFVKFKIRKFYYFLTDFSHFMMWQRNARVGLRAFIQAPLPQLSHYCRNGTHLEDICTE